MARFKHPLNKVKVAAPCKADWDQMIGTDRVRFCAQCSLNVYNLSGMSRTEAESLIARSEQRLCVRFYRRYDESIITEDCPVGLQLLRRRVSYLTKAVTAAVLTFLAACGLHSLNDYISPFRPQRTMGVMALPGERDRPAPGSPAVAIQYPTFVGRVRLGRKPQGKNGNPR